MKVIERVETFDKQGNLVDLAIVGHNEVADIIEHRNDPYVFYIYNEADLLVKKIDNHHRATITYTDINE